MSDVIVGGVYRMVDYVYDSSDPPVLADAGDMALTITLPDGTTVTPTVDHPSTGVYRVDYLTTQPGLHTYRWLGTGLNAASTVGVFNVGSASPRSAVSLAAAKHQCKIDADVSEFDGNLLSWMEAATEAVEDHVGEAIVRRVETVVVKASGGVFVLPYTPILAVTSVATLDGVTSWDVDDLDIDTTTGVVCAVTGPRLWGRLRVVVSVGRTLVPSNYLKAILIITEHLWQTNRAQIATRASRPGVYDDSLSTGAQAGRGFAIPNRALELLGKPPPQAG